MKYILSSLILLLCMGCGNDKELQLAEIKNSNITEILDVSPAYIFYNPKTEDHAELNKQNLISTTNWLVNVDKRLSLKEAIPVVIALQEKKRNASHKKEGVKNYFTGFNPNKKNLCFIEFTNVVYHNDESIASYFKATAEQPERLTFGPDGVVYQDKNYTVETLVKVLENLPEQRHTFVLLFDNQLSFQDYMHIKDLLLTIKSAAVLIQTNEFIFQS